MNEKKIKIAYIGGGSRGWAWTLMKDLAKSEGICGEVTLYDIDYEAALDNEVIGNSILKEYPDAAKWNYKAEKEIGPALINSDFVIISILPGTFKEMYSDVHTPEKFGIYQPVGDTVGPGGIVRALRTIPMFEEIALAVKKYCPDAWVINYTNPMSVCVKALYEAFPEIKAFGCCHEVFGTQGLLSRALEEIKGIKDVKRQEIHTNVIGVNHFTWFTSASYKDTDLFPIYNEYAKRHIKEAAKVTGDSNWMNKEFECLDTVKFDLFFKYGYIAAAGDRHLSEFCPADWYTKSPEQIKSWGFALTSVDWRIKDLENRLEKSKKLKSGEEKFTLEETGEEGVLQMKALLGLGDMLTNINIPNVGQIPNLPLGTVVETNVDIKNNSITPINAGDIPENIFGLIAPIADIENMVVKAGINRDLDLAFEAFLEDPHVKSISQSDAKVLFDEMIDNTKEYLKDYIK